MLQFNDNLTTESVNACYTMEINDAKLKLTSAAVTGT